MTRPLVIYHADCTDRFGAANAAWLKLGDEAAGVAEITDIGQEGD